MEDSIKSVIKYLVKDKLTPCLFFVFSRKNCERYANMIKEYLTTSEEQANIENIIKFQINKLEKSNIYLKLDLNEKYWIKTYQI